MTCDDEVVHLLELIKTVANEMELEDIYKTERQLLYVVCARAKNYLLPISEDAPSEYLDDLIPLRQETDE